MLRAPVITEDLDRILGAELDWERLRDRTVLVTGAAGFLPAYLVEALLRLNEIDPSMGVRVLGLVRDADRAAARFAGYAGRQDLRLVQGDVAERIDVGERADLVVHAASNASPRHFLTDPVGTLDANVLGTRHLLELARRDGSEAFLFFSSGEVYGEVAPDRIPTGEDDYGYLDPTQVRSCYGESKRMGETLCSAYHHQHGVPASVVRPFHTYGPGVRLDDGRVFADFLRDALAGRPIRLRSDGSARRAFCYLADATEAFLRVLLGGERGRSYNVGNEEAEVSMLELAELLGTAFGVPVERAARSAQDAYAVSPISRNSPDTTRMRGLGWTPTTGLLDGFLRTAAALGHHGGEN